MVQSSRKRLSEMLDGDVDHAEPAQGAGDAEVEASQQQRPVTFGEWFQAASAEDLRATLKSLVASYPEAASQVRELLEEDRAHQEWVNKEEKAWKEAEKPAQPAAAKKEAVSPEDGREAQEDLIQACQSIPLRLTADERVLLEILQGALYVSEYTDKVDVYHAGNKARRMALQIQEICAILAGLVVANNFDVARRPLMEKAFDENMHFFRAVFEIGRRYKILNPDKLRGSYGKLMHLLQDSVKSEVARAVGFQCVAPVKTVHSTLSSKKLGQQLLEDPLLLVATREVYESGRDRAEVAAEVKEKTDALAELKRKYAEPTPQGATAPKPDGDLGSLLRGIQTSDESLTPDNVETIVSSISDHFAFQRYNREPCDRIIWYLKTYFSSSSERDWSLAISRGRGGSCLSHSHQTQYVFVLQSLLLWREIMMNMFFLWHSTEDDLLDPALGYRLCDTGQGLNRMQPAPRVSRLMKQILHQVQSEVGGWVGLSVVHLGDRDVPNALVFIDKYNQVPRILGPLVRTLDKLPEVYEASSATKALIDKEFGSLESLRMMILQDFFRHGFDGSGDDGGSCIDGRLTSCWNWCSKIEKKKYFPGFLLTGFNGFDGGFESASGW